MHTWGDPMPISAFLTDASLCIGCKACEVACKEWNQIPDDGFVWSGQSYDNTRHCANAGCLEACPTGSIVRTEVGSVFVQPDICNGCGYCVVSCPFGVIDKRPEDGRAFKCTFCYDRQKAGLVPACAKACPTESIQFGDLEELKQRGKNRVQDLQRRGYHDAQIYNPQETSVGGIHAFFVILGEPEAYNLPPAPEVPTVYLKSAWTSALVSAAIIVAIVFAAFAI